MKKLFLGALVLFVGASLSFGQARLPATVTAGAILKAKAGNLLDEATTGTATSTAAAATLNTDSGTVTTEALTTAGLADYTFTLTDSKITTASKVFWALTNGTNTQGTLAVGPATKAAGSSVVLIHNLHATQALNGTIKIQFWIVQ